MLNRAESKYRVRARVCCIIRVLTCGLLIYVYAAAD